MDRQRSETGARKERQNGRQRHNGDRLTAMREMENIELTPSRNFVLVSGSRIISLPGDFFLSNEFFKVGVTIFIVFHLYNVRNE